MTLGTCGRVLHEACILALQTFSAVARATPFAHERLWIVERTEMRHR